MKIIPVLLPTEDASPLFIYLGTGDLILHKNIPHKIGENGNTNQHLYLCSNQPINHGDYFYSKAFDNIRQSAVDKYEADGCFRVEFTTDQKLWDIKQIDGVNYGVPAIDGNTKALIELKDPLSRFKQVNFLEEFCKRYNQKDNQKVDVEKLAKDYSDSIQHISGDPDLESQCREHFINGYKSNAGGFSLEDMRKCWNYAGDFFNEHSANNELEMNFDEFVQSLTKSEPNQEMGIYFDTKTKTLIFK